MLTISLYRSLDNACFSLLGLGNRFVPILIKDQSSYCVVIMLIFHYLAPRFMGENYARFIRSFMNVWFTSVVGHANCDTFESLYNLVQVHEAKGDTYDKIQLTAVYSRWVTIDSLMKVHSFFQALITLSLANLAVVNPLR